MLMMRKKPSLVRYKGTLADCLMPDSRNHVTLQTFWMAYFATQLPGQWIHSNSHLQHFLPLQDVIKAKTVNFDKNILNTDITIEIIKLLDWILVLRSQGIVPEPPAIFWNVCYAQNSHYLNSSGFYYKIPVASLFMQVHKEKISRAFIYMSWDN